MRKRNADIIKLGGEPEFQNASMSDFDQSYAPNLKQFEQLFYKNQRFLCMIADRIVNDTLIAEDLVQDFFIRLWESQDWTGFKSFEAFAYRAIKNSSIDYLRRQQTIDRKMIAMVQPEAPSGIYEIPPDDARLKRILQLLDELPAQRKKIFEMHVLDSRSYKEIAEELNISVNTVKTQLKRAYLSLRTKMIVLLILNYLIRFFS